MPTNIPCPLHGSSATTDAGRGRTPPRRWRRARDRDTANVNAVPDDVIDACRDHDCDRLRDVTDNQPGERIHYGGLPGGRSGDGFGAGGWQTRVGPSGIAALEVR